MRGDVQEEHFARLANGQHPMTGEQLVRYQAAREYMNGRGETVSTMEHRAGWDATFSAPKSVSLTALVGGDERVREAHRESVEVALDELEKYVQARIGGNHPAETTGKWVAARFEHDSARPVDGYAAPQLHTHVVFFNLTETENGETRALQPRELYRSQQYATAIYRSELALRLKELATRSSGQERPAGDQGLQPEYLEASSPRRQQIEEHLAKEIARSRRGTDRRAPDARRQSCQRSRTKRCSSGTGNGAQFGDQPEHVIDAAHERQVAIETKPGAKHQTIESAADLLAGEKSGAPRGDRRTRTACAMR